jgi:hypothetical protein
MQATSPIEFTRMLPGQTLCKELLQDEWMEFQGSFFILSQRSDCKQGFRFVNGFTEPLLTVTKNNYNAVINSRTQFLTTKRTSYYWKKISHPVIQCCPVQRIFHGAMESSTAYPHFEVRKTF